MPKLELEIFGSASNKVIKTLTIDPIDDTLLNILRQNDIPIASSCLGEGMCKRCIININNEEKLSCLVLSKDLKEEKQIIKVDYL